MSQRQNYDILFIAAFQPTSKEAYHDYVLLLAHLGNLVADAFRVTSGADIALINGGGVRAPLPSGDIHYIDIFTTMPFGNMLCMTEVTGAELLDMMEYYYSMTEAETTRDGKAVGENGSFQQVSGLRLTVHTDIPTSIEVNDEDMLIGVGETRRVSNVEVLQADGSYAPLEPEKTYTLASTNYFIKQGGSGMGVALAEHPLLIDESLADYQVLLDYLISLNGDFSAYRQPEGRITIQ